MLDKSRFSLNRIIYPGLNMENFFKLTKEIGLDKVELRNDLPGNKILDDLSEKDVKDLAVKYGIKILTINAIQKFNLASVFDKMYEETKEMLDMASSIGCSAIVLCPNNDVNDKRTDEQFYSETVSALKKLSALFEERGITGLVEPFGFDECSLRSKKTASQAIKESGCSCYKMVHDTFHHYLGPDDTVFPEYTGLVHISGVETDIPKSRIRDEHRVMVGEKDIMHNKAQIKAFESEGYSGVYSYEPFSSDVQNMSLDNIKTAIKESIEFIIN